MSAYDAVDGFLPRSQPTLRPSMKEESNGPDQDGWIGYRESGFPLGADARNDRQLHAMVGITGGQLMSGIG